MDMKKAMGPWPHPAPMVRALGTGWMDANQVQPWEDTDSRLRYVVYSPSYLGALLVCRFNLFSPARWWHEGMQVGVSGVTLWRLADSTDQDFIELDSAPIAAQPNAAALVQLLHWWSWYRHYKGIP
ncbi:hypothetical protein Pfra02_44670 [Pseudomonas fragi]|nr:hypothetical protein Pfra02_44670 [Pseudomonas fragi]